MVFQGGSKSALIDNNVFFNDQASPAVFLNSLTSVGLEWEKTYQTDIGLEVGFDNNRYSIEIDYYNKQTKDLLLNRPLPGTAGESRLENVGEVENKGFEILRGSSNLDTIESSNDKNWVLTEFNNFETLKKICIYVVLQHIQAEA